MLPASIPVEEFPTEIARFIADVQQRDFSAVLAGAHQIVREGVAENFQGEIDRHATPWLPRKDNKTHPLLRLTLAMYRAAAVQDAAGQIQQIASRESFLGISLAVIPYARAQNLGYPERNLPPREYYYVSDDTEERLEEFVADQAGQQLLGN